MGKKSKARRARRKAKMAMAIFADPKGDKLDVNGKTPLGRLTLDEAEQGEIDFWPDLSQLFAASDGEGGDFYDPDVEGGIPYWF